MAFLLAPTPSVLLCSKTGERAALIHTTSPFLGPGDEDRSTKLLGVTEGGSSLLGEAWE